MAADFSLQNLIAKKSVAKSRQKTSAPNDALVLCLITKRMDYFRSAQRLKASIFLLNQENTKPAAVVDVAGRDFATVGGAAIAGAEVPAPTPKHTVNTFSVALRVGGRIAAQI